MPQRTPAQLLNLINSMIDSGGTPRISAADLRGVLIDFRDSVEPWVWAQGGSGQIADGLIPATIARDGEITAAIDALRGAAPANLNTLEKIATALEAIMPGSTWSTGTAAPSGGADGDFYLRQGTTAPGIYYRSGGSWALVLAPGTGDGGGGTSGTAAAPLVAMLGQPNLAETDVADSGVLNAAGAGTSRLAFSVMTGQPNSGEINVRWDPDADAHFLPLGASYDSTTGILTLPEGVWIIEAVMSLIIARSSTQPANTNTISSTAARLYEGGELRYSEDAFFWGSLNNHPTLSVTGSLVVPEGRTDTVQVRLITTPGGSQNPTLQTTVENAHMEAIRLGGAAPAPTADGGHIAWSADTTFSAAEFLAGTEIAEGAMSGDIPAQTGFGYLGLWLPGDGWTGIRQIDIDHGPNGLNDLAAPVALTVSGVAGQYRRYNLRQSGDVVSGGTLRWR